MSKRSSLPEQRIFVEELHSAKTFYQKELSHSLRHMSISMAIPWKIYLYGWIQKCTRHAIQQRSMLFQNVRCRQTHTWPQKKTPPSYPILRLSTLREPPVALPLEIHLPPLHTALALHNILRDSTSFGKRYGVTSPDSRPSIGTGSRRERPATSISDVEKSSHLGC